MTPGIGGQEWSVMNGGNGKWRVEERANQVHNLAQTTDPMQSTVAAPNAYFPSIPAIRAL
ncbi:MAG: hypothetical protein ABJF23_06255 [Bryobacteraceae bacterium]